MSFVARARARLCASILLCLPALWLAGCSGGAQSVSENRQPPPTLSITTKSLGDGAVNADYSARLVASGGTPPYRWKLAAGALPAGLSLDGASGAVWGVPTSPLAAGAMTFQVSDAGTPAQSATAQLSLTIAAPLSIATTSLPNAQMGVAYSTTLAASGGTAPLAWTVSSGALPAGLTLDAATGVISGTPRGSATPLLTFQVSDAAAPAQSASARLGLTVTMPLRITTTSLPDGQVGAAYSTGLAASGGTAPLSWSITSGTLPDGLAFNGKTGLISGTPTVSAAQLPVTFEVTDAGAPAQTGSATLSLTIAPENISVAIIPGRAGITVGQQLVLSATTNDSAGVTWSVSPGAGSVSPQNSGNGGNVTYIPSAVAGAYTLTATSVTDNAKKASITVGVTDLPGVYTYHNDPARDGVNAREFALTAANVGTATFGKLFSCVVDGAIYAQPLWVANLRVNGAQHNVIFVATEHDSLYAFDADESPCRQLWKVSLIDSIHGATSGEVTVPDTPTGFLVGTGAADIQPEVGVTGTPVIDPVAGILYVVSKSMNVAGSAFYQRLHAIDLATGTERTGSPELISATYPGGGTGVVTFDPRQENQRPGLTLVSGIVYIAWGSHEDAAPWYGWIVGYSYNGNNFSQTAALNVAPYTEEAGIWMGGGAPAADNESRLYLSTGNGNFDATSASAPNNDYGDCFLQLTAALTVSSWFSPTNQANENVLDKDLGSGGAAVVLNLPAGMPQHLIVGGGKDGILYLLDGDHMGGSGDTNARQAISVGHGIFATAAFWNNTVYLAPASAPIQAYAFNTSTNLLATSAGSHTPATFGWPGSTPSVSASGAASNGIVWGLNTNSYCTKQSKSCGPAVLHAFDANNLGIELWNSTMVSGDAAGLAVKFAVPTVANGKVYVGTRGSDSAAVYGSSSGELDVYGLKP